LVKVLLDPDIVLLVKVSVAEAVDNVIDPPNDTAVPFIVIAEFAN